MLFKDVVRGPPLSGHVRLECGRGGCYFHVPVDLVPTSSSFEVVLRREREDASVVLYGTVVDVEEDGHVLVSNGGMMERVLESGTYEVGDPVYTLLLTRRTRPKRELAQDHS